MTPLFSILHPSARPHKWREIHDAWLSECVHPENVEYVLCDDERWGFPAPTSAEPYPGGGSPAQIAHATRLPNKRFGAARVATNTSRRCYVDSVNIAAKASTGRILIVIADDQYPCEQWDNKIWNRFEFKDQADPSDFGWVMEVSTGTPNEHDRGMIVMPILSRARYERLGYIFHPFYESMYADNDFYEHAQEESCIIDARHLMFPHRHEALAPDWQKTGIALLPTAENWDAVYAAQNRPEAYALGEKVIAWRRRIGFGDAIDAAEKIDGWMTREELETLSFWASQHQTVIEIGAYKGRTAYALAAGCQGKVVSIDSDFVGDEFRQNTFGSGALFHQDDSVATAKYWSDVDMVFIDGDHSYEAVKADLEAWTPKTRHLICGHDYCEADAPGVVQAVLEKFGTALPATTNWPLHLGPGRLWSVSLDAKQAAIDALTSWNGTLNAAKPKPARRNIAIALPGENFSGLWVAKLLEVLFNLQKTWNFVTVINYTSNVGITRKTITQQIEKMGPGFVPEYILWIDDDQIVESGIVDMLIADADAFPDADIVAGWTWIASGGAHHNEPQVSCGRMNLERGELSHAEYHSVQAAGGVFEVHWTGFPVVVMRYGALAKAGKHPFAHYPCEESPWGECGEDISFCKRLRDGGGKIMVDSRAFVPHLKLRALGPMPASKEEVELALAGVSSR